MNLKFTWLCLRKVYGVLICLTLIYSRRLTTLGSCYCKKQIDVRFLCVCPLIEDKFCYNIVKDYHRTTRLRLVVPKAQRNEAIKVAEHSFQVPMPNLP